MRMFVSASSGLIRHRMDVGRQFAKPLTGMMLCAILLSPNIAWAVDPPITDLAYSNDGSSIVVVSQLGIRVEATGGLGAVGKLDTGQTPGSESPELQSKVQTKIPNLHCVEFSPDGKHFAVGGGTPSEEGVVEVFRWPSAERVARFSYHLDSVRSVAWVDSERLLSASIDRQIKFWSIKDEAKSLGEFRGHSRSVNALCILPDEKSFVSAGVDQSVRVWRLDSRTPVRTLNQHTGPVHALALCPRRDGLPMVASASADRTIRFWQPTIGRMVRYVRLRSVPLDIAWLNDGLHIAAACEDGRVRLINADDVKVVGEKSIFENPITHGWLYAIEIHPSRAKGVAGGSGGILREISVDLPERD